MNRVADDARAEMMFAAAARERRNRPTGLVAGAAALLVIAALAAGLALASRARAAQALRRQAGENERAGALVAELEGLRAEDDSGGLSGTGDPIPDLTLFGTLEQLATDRGLAKPQQPNAQSSERGKITVKTYRYQNMRSENLEALLRWVRAATDEVGGLEVFGLDLRSDAAGWSMNATFRRWERP